MKKLLLLNAFILSSLALSAQNWINNSDNNVYASNVQVNYNTNLTNIIPQTNVAGTNTNIPSINRNRSNNSALSNLNTSNTIQVVQVQTQVQQQSGNKTKTQKKVPVQTNNTNVSNDNVGNTLDNNVGNVSNPNTNRGGNNINDVNVNVNSNPQLNTTKTTTKTVVVMEEFKGTDFKPIGLSGRDYSNGGKMKKGVKNFPKADRTKVKHKRKPAYKKVKYHTSKCAKW